MQEVLDRVLEANARAFAPQPGDYTQDGLLHCGVCGEPKQIRLPALPPGIKPFAPFVKCRCRREAEAEEARRRQEARRQREIDRNTARCFQSPGQAACSFETDDGANPALTRVAKRYCAAFETFRNRGAQRGLLLFGPPGGGKSFIACAVCGALLQKGYRCRVVNLPQIINEMRASCDRNGVLDGLTENDLVVLDDFGTQRATQYMDEQVFEIVNALALARTPVIVTTNLTAEELKNPAAIADARVFSRLMELCYPLAVNCADRRKTGLRENKAAVQTLLGK